MHNIYIPVVLFHELECCPSDSREIAWTPTRSSNALKDQAGQNAGEQRESPQDKREGREWDKEVNAANKTSPRDGERFYYFKTVKFDSHLPCWERVLPNRERASSICFFRLGSFRPLNRHEVRSSHELRKFAWFL